MYTAAVARDGWGGLAVRGVLTVLFGIAAVFWPELTLVGIVYLFSVLLLASGLIGIVMGILSSGKSALWPLQVVLGVVELAFGVYFLRHISVSVHTFLIIAGIVLVIRGLFEIAGSFFERSSDTTSMTLNSITGLLAIVAGVWLMLEPKTVGLAFLWIFGVYALVVGSIEIAIAVRAREV